MIVNREWRGPLATLSTLLLLLAVSAGAAFAQSPTVTVESEADHITVRILEPTELSTVLEAVCRHLQARCDGLDAAAGAQIPPATVTDTWPGVVRKLLEGSGLNHIALSRAGKAPPRLLLSTRPSGVPDSVVAGTLGTERDSADDRSPADGQDSPVAGRAAETDRERWQRERQEREGRDSVPESPGSRGAGSGSGPGEPSQEPEWPTATAGPSAPFTAPPGTVATPFPGPEGTPIVMPKDNTPPGQAPNPFLDPFGNPIPPPPGGPPVIGSPFLGPDGKPILTTPLPPGQVPNPFATAPPPK